MIKIQGTLHRSAFFESPAQATAVAVDNKTNVRKPLLPNPFQPAYLTCDLRSLTANIFEEEDGPSIAAKAPQGRAMDDQLHLFPEGERIEENKPRGPNQVKKISKIIFPSKCN